MIRVGHRDRNAEHEGAKENMVRGPLAKGDDGSGNRYPVRAEAERCCRCWEFPVDCECPKPVLDKPALLFDRVVDDCVNGR